jgi:type I pantothenate kinase
VAEEEAMEYARMIWRTINRPNLEQNVLPTRSRATLVLRKSENHKVRRLSLRKL